jgi:hypothetical protein
MMRWKKYEREMGRIELKGNRHDLYYGSIT